jgi:hypothetical protein
MRRTLDTTNDEFTWEVSQTRHPAKSGRMLPWRAQ